MPRQSEPSKPLRNDIAIDTLRALACVALVSFHVAGDAPGAGMELPADHWLNVLNRVFVDMRMPLFSFLSGLVFVSLSQTLRPPQALIQSKARRLLLPMLCVGALFWAVRDLSGAEQQPLATIPFIPFAHFWFLQATFVIMAVFIALTWVSGRRDVWVAGLLMVFSAAAWITGNMFPHGVFSVNMALHLMPFFMAGYLCSRFGVPRLNVWLVYVVLILLVLIGTMLATKIISLEAQPRRSLSVGCGLLFCLSLLSLRPAHPVLARLGAMSYAIFLFHVFFTAASREAWIILAPDTPAVVIWLSGVSAGLLGPVIAYYVICRSDWAALALLGLKPANRAVRRPVRHAQS